MDTPQRDLADERYYVITLVYRDQISLTASMRSCSVLNPLGRGVRRSRAVLDLGLADLERSSERVRWLAIASAIQDAFDPAYGAPVAPDDI